MAQQVATQTQQQKNNSRNEDQKAAESMDQ